jgi:hypothetical protein
MDYAAKFDEGLAYDDFLKAYGTDEHQRRWAGLHAQVKLTAAQRELLATFRRDMKVLCLAGTWCGDCVNQCPIFDHFTRATDKIAVRFFDRDAQPELAADLSICAAARVPAVLFLSEDGYPCGRYGDRTLSKYRQLAGEQTSPARDTGPLNAGQSLLEAVVQEWLNEFERIQLMLRTSARLRGLHGD